MRNERVSKNERAKGGVPFEKGFCGGCEGCHYKRE